MVNNDIAALSQSFNLDSNPSVLPILFPKSSGSLCTAFMDLGLRPYLLYTYNFVLVSSCVFFIFRYICKTKLMIPSAFQSTLNSL